MLMELKKMLPRENFVFLADQLYVPYGEKSKKELVQRCFKITDYLIKKHNIKMMVVACNTATCGAIEELRAKYSLPIVGTVPAVKPAAQKTKSGIIAAISTPSTSKSAMMKNLIKENCQGIKVLNIGCKNLENAVEEGELNNSKVGKLLKKYLKSVKNSDTDYIVLGCTHYPFLRKPIQKIVGPGVNLLDSGEAIARHTKSLLNNRKIQNGKKNRRKTSYYTTGQPGKFSKVATALLKRRVRSRRVKI